MYPNYCSHADVVSSEEAHRDEQLRARINQKASANKSPGFREEVDYHDPFMGSGRRG